VAGVVVSRRNVLQVFFSVIEGVVVYVMAVVARRRFCDLSVHLNLVRFFISTDSADRVEAASGSLEPPVIVFDPFKVVQVNYTANPRAKPDYSVSFWKWWFCFFD
jgi:hypothetical protein